MSVKSAKLIHYEDAIVWELIALSAAKSPKVFHPQASKPICNAAKWSLLEMCEVSMNDDTWQRNASVFPLFVFHSGHFSLPLVKYEERVFISSIRV